MNVLKSFTVVFLVAVAPLEGATVQQLQAERAGKEKELQSVEQQYRALDKKYKQLEPKVEKLNKRMEANKTKTGSNLGQDLGTILENSAARDAERELKDIYDQRAGLFFKGMRLQSEVDGLAERQIKQERQERLEKAKTIQAAKLPTPSKTKSPPPPAATPAPLVKKEAPPSKAKTAQAPPPVQNLQVKTAPPSASKTNPAPAGLPELKADAKKHFEQIARLKAYEEKYQATLAKYRANPDSDQLAELKRANAKINAERERLEDQRDGLVQRKEAYIRKYGGPNPALAGSIVTFGSYDSKPGSRDISRDLARASSRDASSSTAREAATGAAKEASKSAAKESAKESSKDTAKSSAKDTGKSTAKSAASSAAHPAPSSYAKPY